MLLSRFWYLFLAICAAGAVGAAMLAQGIINNRSDEQLTDQLRRDRFELEAFLRLDARSRIDRIAFITVDSKFGSLLRKAGGVKDTAKLREIASEVKKLMGAHVKNIQDAAGDSATKEQRDALKPDIAFSVDRAGRIIAQLGPLEANPPGAGLGTYPLVKRALQGYLRDDVWVYDRRVYRMAARPVVSGSQYAGAIIYGYKFTSAFASELSNNLGGAAVGFFHGNNVFIFEAGNAETGAPSQGELAAAIPGVLNDSEYQEKGRTGPVELEGGGRATYQRIVGSAAAANVGLVVARPRTVIASPQALFDAATKEDVAALPQRLLGAAAVIAALLGMLFIFLERDRPYRALLTKTGAIAAGDSDRLIITQWRGGFRRLADNINQAIDKEVEKAAEMAPRSKKKANLDELLGPTPESAGDAFFGFAGDSPAGESKPGPEAFAPAPPGAAAPTPPVGTLTPAVGAIPAAAATPAPPVAAPTPAPGAPTPPVAPPGPPAAPAAAAAAPDAGSNGWDEEAHFQATYEQYIATREQCGEPTKSLSFEKFGKTLRKTRDQVMSKHGGRSVKFTVYVKAGKAALKAAPVK